MASSLDQTSSDLKKSRAVLHHLSDSFQSIQSHLYSIMALSDQWGTFQNSFVSVQVSIEKHIKELEVKERELNTVRVLLENREKEVELRQKEVDFVEKEVMERKLGLEVREKDFWERVAVAELERKRDKEWSKVLEAKERRIGEREKAIEGCGEIEKRWRELEEREKVVAERCEAVEVGEDRIVKRCIEAERREKEVEERWKLKEEEFDRQLQELEVMENVIDERGKVAELKEKQVEERCRVVELREREVDERSKAQELKEKELSEFCKEFEMKGKDLNERLGELELKEKQIEERCDVIVLRERELDECCKVQELNGKKLSDQCKGLQLKQKQIDERYRLIELREREIDQQYKAQELREKQLNECCKGVELKEKHINERLKELDLKENQIELKVKQTEEASEELKLKEKRMIEHTEELELKDEQISENLKSLELREKQIERDRNYINERCEASRLREMEISERYKALDSKEKEINELSRALELKKKDISMLLDESFKMQECKTNEVDEPCSNLGIDDEIQSLNIKQCVMMDGKTLQMFLNDRVDEHRFMGEEVCDALKVSDNPAKLVIEALDGFYSPHLRRGNVVYEASAVRSSCLLLLEQLMNMKPKFGRKMKRRANNVAHLWRSKMKDGGESRIVALSFLLLVVTFRLTSLVETDELERLYEMVDQDKIAPQLRLELDLLEEKEGSYMAKGSLEITTRPLQSDTDAVASSSMNHFSEIHLLCCNMNANGLISCIGQHLTEQYFCRLKVLDSLRCAADPAKLLLDAVKIFNLPKSTAVEKASCIFLLEQLMKLQKKQSSLNSLSTVEHLVKPPLKITLDLRQKAKKFARIWKQTMAKNGLKILDVYGFLQFLVTYKVARSFNADELFKLFKLCYSGDLVYRPEQNPYLCRALGLAKRIPGLVKSLIKGNRRLQAVKYICTFVMESMFPLAPLLKDHLKFTEGKSEKLRMGRNNTHAAKVDAARFEIRNLQTVLVYISDYELESDFPPVALESRIEELEMQIAKLKTATAEVEHVAVTEQKEGLKDDISENLEMDTVENSSTQLVNMAEENYLPAASPTDTGSEFCAGEKRTSRPSPSFELPQNKRLRTGAAESLDSFNIPVASPAIINSMKGMSASQPGQGSWQQLGPCTPGHQVHVRPMPSKTLSAVNDSSTQFGFAGSSYGSTPYKGSGQIERTGDVIAELKTSTAGMDQMAVAERKEGLKSNISTNTQKDFVDNKYTQLVEKADKVLSPASPETTSESFVGKHSSSSSSSLVVPQQEKHLRIGTLESSAQPNIPVACPITTHSTSMYPPQPSLQPWRQLGPYTFGHLAHVRPNGFPVLRPGQMPYVNGPTNHFGVPDSSHSVTPCRGSGQFIPTAGFGLGGTPALGPGQFRPTAGIGPGGPGQFRPTARIGPSGSPAPGTGQYRPTAGIGPGGFPASGLGQFRPTSGNPEIYPGGTLAPGQYRYAAGFGISGTPSPTSGYFAGGQVPYRPR